MWAANISKERSEENPLTYSTHFVQKQLDRERSLRSQLAYVTLLNYCRKGHKCNNTGSNTISPSQQLKRD